MKPIHVIGIDPETGEPSAVGLQRISKARVLAGGRRFLERFGGHAARKIPIHSPAQEALEAIGREALEGEEVVVLADGDPGFFGIGRLLIDTLGQEAVILHPALTTLQVAASRLKIPWQDIRTVSLHGSTDTAPLMALLARQDRVAVYTGSSRGPVALAGALLRRGVDTFRMHVLEDLGGDSERIRCLELEEAASRSFDALNFVILERKKQPEIPLRLGLDDGRYRHPKGLITKREVRAAGLSILDIAPHHTVWDLGSGCGAVAVEASVLAYRGRVLAVEKDPDRVDLIRENIRRTGAYGVEAVPGEIPGCLGSLPDPDRVFLGGGLARGDGLLEALMKRIRPGGRLVIHLVLLGSLFKAKALLASRGWRYRITHLQVGRSQELADDLRIEALNPVYILSASNPAGQRRKVGIET